MSARSSHLRPHRRATVAVTITMITMGCGLLFEAIAVWMLTLPHGATSRLVGAVALHIASGGACAEAMRVRAAMRAAPSCPSVYRTGWLCAVAFPIFGPCACLGLVLFGPMRTRGEQTAGDSLEQRRSRAAAAALERRRAQQQLGPGIESIGDALMDRDANVRVAAIDALRGDTSKKAVKFLSASRLNTVFDVRIRALENLGQISKDHGDRINAARTAWSRAPESADANSALALACFDYGELGIEDRATTQLLFEQAASHAAMALSAGGHNRDVALARARALCRLNRLGEAEAECRALVYIDEHDAEAGLVLAEVEFQQKNVDALHDTCRRLLRQAGRELDEEAVEAAKLWIRGGAAAERGS